MPGIKRVSLSGWKSRPTHPSSRVADRFFTEFNVSMDAALADNFSDASLVNFLTVLVEVRTDQIGYQDRTLIFHLVASWRVQPKTFPHLLRLHDAN